VGGEVLASVATVEAAGTDVVVASERSLNAKGFKDPVRVMEVVGLKGAGLQLPARAEEWVTLAPEWRVELRQVENKVLTGREWPGRLLRAALSEAELACDAPLEMYSDWRLVRVDADGAQLPGELYAKVVSTPGPDGGVFLRFTAVSPEWAQRLRHRAG
jgi:adenylate cyclase